jgi:hypothetical protein
MIANIFKKWCIPPRGMFSSVKISLSGGMA